MKYVVVLKKLWQRVLYRTVCLLSLAIFLVSILGTTLIHATGANSGGQPAWTSPNVMAMKRVSAIDSTQHQPTFLGNLDCTFMTYRMVNDTTMRSGCFSSTAFGLLDSDSDTVIFNGTDEGLPLLSYSANQVLAPWPNALDLLTLDATDTGGSYIGMYRNPLGQLQNQRNLLGQLTTKKMNNPPEVSLKDQNGQRLVVNAQTMAFSDSGSWMVVETLGGSFVRINLATLDSTAFAQAFGSQGSPGALLKSQVTVSDDGRYVAIYNATASSFKVYDLTTCGSDTTTWQSSNCQSHDYWPFVNQQIPSLQSVRHLRFVNDGLLSFEATASDNARSGVYELAPTDSITSLTDYIGLGDSYTSGEGAFDYLSGTDTGDNLCHLSVNSYPLLLTRDLFSSAGGHSVACSGAVINDIGSTKESYRGQVKGGASLQELSQHQPAFLDSIKASYTPGYIAQQSFVKQYQPRLLTVSIGGNDIGFGDMLQNCVEPHISRHTSDSTCYNTYESRLEMVKLIDRTVPRWTALYKQLAAESPGTSLYALGYPSIMSDTGRCGLNVNLGKGELEFAEELISYLDGAIQQAATAAGIPYIDISQALAGHRLCEASGSDIAVNGLTAGNNSGALGFNVLGRESYHPNAFGQMLIEQKILEKSHNLTDTFTRSSQNVNNSTQNILNVPKSGRGVNTLVADDTLISPVLKTAVNTSVQANGQLDGLQPNTTYTIRLDGPSGTILATFLSDANGDIAGGITVPDGTADGGHTIDITGSNQAGDPADITQPVYVSDRGDDADGDGIADLSDSCPAAINSGQDIDQDGVDDVCDGIIGLAPITTTGSGSNDVSPGSPVNATDKQTKPDIATNPIESSVITTGSGLPNRLSSLGGVTLAGLAATANRPPTKLLDVATLVPNKIRGATTLGVQTTSPSRIRRGGIAASARAVSLTGLPLRHTVKITNWPLQAFMALFLLLLALLLFYVNRLVTRTHLAEQVRILVVGILHKYLPKFKALDYNSAMRKFGVFLLAALLFISLFGLAFSTSSNIAFTHPNKVEKWLNDSNLYGAFVSNAIDQAQKTAGSDQSGGVSLSDTVVKQAAQSAFSSQALQKNVNTFLDSNYAWLEGKTSTPNFSVNLAPAKQTFAQRVGQYTQTYLAGLPVCTDAQLAQINPQTADPLSLSCRPGNIDPATVGIQVTEQIANNGDFLSNPVITASSINPKGTVEGKPYYQKYASLPKVYRLGTKAPWIAAALVILSSIGVFFLAARKRAGAKIIGIELAVAGLVLLLTKFVSDQAFNKAENHIFNESAVGQLQKALTNFFHLVKDQLVKVDMWFGAAYIILALIILVVFLSTRQKRLRPIVANGGLDVPKPPVQTAARPPKKPAKPTSYPKRPRLIQ